MARGASQLHPPGVEETQDPLSFVGGKGGRRQKSLHKKGLQAVARAGSKVFRGPHNKERGTRRSWPPERILYIRTALKKTLSFLCC